MELGVLWFLDSLFLINPFFYGASESKDFVAGHEPQFSVKTILN